MKNKQATNRVVSIGLFAALLVTLLARPIPSVLAALTITANPNPVIVPKGQTQGTATLTWDGGNDHPYAEAWVKVDNADETFVVESGKGTRQVTIELGKTYLFKLSDSNELLASVTVTAKQDSSAPASGGDAPDRIVTPKDKSKVDDMLKAGETTKDKHKLFKGRHGSRLGPAPAPIPPVVRLDILGGGGGNFFEYVCEPGRVLVGIRAYTGLWIDNVQAVCARLGAERLEDARPEGPVFGGAQGKTNNGFDCPSQTIATGVVVNETQHQPVLGAIKLVCVDLFTRQVSGYEHYSYGMKGGDEVKSIDRVIQPKRQDCPANTIAVGIRGRAGTYLDGLGLICR